MLFLCIMITLVRCTWSAIFWKNTHILANRKISAWFVTHYKIPIETITISTVQYNIRKRNILSPCWKGNSNRKLTVYQDSQFSGLSTKGLFLPTIFSTIFEGILNARRPDTIWSTVCGIARYDGTIWDVWGTGWDPHQIGFWVVSIYQDLWTGVYIMRAYSSNICGVVTSICLR